MHVQSPGKEIELREAIVICSGREAVGNGKMSVSGRTDVGGKGGTLGGMCTLEMFKKPKEDQDLKRCLMMQYLRPHNDEG